MADLLSEIPVLFVLIGTTLLHFGERRVHGYNYDFLRFVEGEELIPKQMKKYYVMVAILPWVCFVSSHLTPTSFTYSVDPVLALCFVLSGCLLRLWSIRSLGRLWSQRCVFVAGMPRVKRGPYRIIKHPEYFARALEGLGYLLFFGANPASGLLWVYTQALVPSIIKTETRQLQELSVAPLHLQHTSSRVGTLNS